MTTLKDKETEDKISYQLNLSKSTATFEIESFENIRSNLNLVDKMVKIFIEEEIKNVFFKFDGKGRKKVKCNKIDENGKKINFEYVFNDVCYIPDKNKIRLFSSDDYNNSVYLCPIDSFKVFYKSNMNILIKDKYYKYTSLEEKPDKDGFITVVNTRKKKKEFKKTLKAKINFISKNNRNNPKNIDVIHLNNENLEEIKEELDDNNVV